MSGNERKLSLFNIDNALLARRGSEFSGYRLDISRKSVTYENDAAQLDENKKGKDKDGKGNWNWGEEEWVHEEFQDKEHSVGIRDLLKSYGHEEVESGKLAGLNENKVKLNRECYGANILRNSKRSSSEWRKFVFEIFGGLNSLLWICALISLTVYLVQVLKDGQGDMDNLSGGISLIVIILIAGIFSYYQGYKSNKVMESFRKLLPQNVTVIRNGNNLEIDSEQLVVGDIVEMKYGEKIPADLRVLECSMLKTDHSSLTGESDPQERLKECTSEDIFETKNLLFFSTTVTEGTGSGVVVRVGNNTVMGRLAAIAATVKAEKTPLAKEAKRLILLLSGISVIFAVGFFIASFLLGFGWVDALFNATGIMLANVPENLQVTLTLILIMAAKRMAKNECIVKNLHAMETLGAASVLCSDKTGTLTQNKMCVNHIWVSGSAWRADGTTKEEEEELEGAGITPILKGNNLLDWNEASFGEFGKVATLCVAVKTIQGEGGAKINGEPSDMAILDFMGNTWNEDWNEEGLDSFRERHPKIFEIPFNSRNKYHLTAHRMEEEGEGEYVFVGMKGAPEIILELCGKIIVEGEDEILDEFWKEKVESGNGNFAEMGERVLAFCDCKLPGDCDIIGENLVENLKKKFRFLGLIALVDPPRPAVPSAIEKCRGAGIQVVMITGDHPITATVIARNVGILSPTNLLGKELQIFDGSVPLSSVNMATTKTAVITGATLEEIREEDFYEILINFKEIVFARTSPDQKVRIVEGFQKIGHIVAVTGDGINDGAALKRSDIGVAMGSGTDVSKEVADLILMDDDFTTVVTAVEQGRMMFENLKKLMRYVMSDNVAEMYMALVFIFIQVPLPMGPIAMMLSTLCIDIFPALSLSKETAEADIMKRKPRTKEEGKLMSAQMISYAYGQISVIECAAGFFSYFVTFAIHGWHPKDVVFRQRDIQSVAINDLEDSFGQEWTSSQRATLVMEAQSAFFLAIVLTQFTNAICCKTRRLSIFQKGMTNYTMNGGLVVMLAVGFGLIYIPGLNSILNFAPLSYPSVVAIVPFCLYIFIYDEFRRFLVRNGNGNWFTKELET